MPETLHQLHHTSFTAKDGLFGAVKALAQSTDGYLWAGTSEGLYRFDGVTFESYVPDHGSLPDAPVTALLALPDGSLWVGFLHGAATHIVSGTATSYTEKEGYPYGTTRNLVQTPDGAVWAAVLGNVVRFDGHAWHNIRGDWNFPGKSGVGMLVDRQGTLWVSTGERLAYLPSGSHAFVNSGLLNVNLVAIVQSPDGILWLSDGDRDTVRSYCSPLERGTCTDPGSTIPIGSWTVLFPKLGGMWFATEKHGVRRMDMPAVLQPDTAARADTAAESFEKTDAMSNSYCWALLEDREGDVWAATEGGLDRFRYRNLLWFDTAVSDMRLLPGDRGKPWLTTSMQAGPFQLPGDTPIPPALALHLQWLDTATRDPFGAIWLANHNGLYRWTAGTVKTIVRPPQTGNGHIYAIAVDRQQNAWLSVAGVGEYRYRNDVWEHIDVPAARPDITAVYAYVDAADRTWLAYDARHFVAVIADGKVQTFAAADGLSVGSPTVIAGDDQRVWVGGSQGLAYFQGGRFHALRDDTLKPFAGVLGILSTPLDGLWLSMPQRIVHIAKSALDRCLAANCGAVSYEQWDTTSDLPAPLLNSAKSLERALSLRGGDGKLWFAGVGGVAMIDPRAIMHNALPPQVSIRSLTLDGKHYTATERLLVQTLVRSMQVDYTAPSLRLPERVRFRYRLENWDTDWQEAGTRRQAIYSNLGPGKYTFRVITCNEDGVWNQAGPAVALTVQPAFYQTPWFLVLCVAAAGSLLWLAYRYRVQSILHHSNELLMERVSERERIAQDLHDTFLQSIQGLMLKFQVATGRLRTDDPARPIFEATLAQSDLVLLEGRKLVEDLHVYNKPADGLLDTLRAIAAELQTVYPGQFAMDLQGTPHELNAIASGEIVNIAREALSNAFRHARATNVRLSITYTAKVFRLEVSDDGSGIQPDVLARGFLSGHWGLRSMKERARRLEARYAITSSQENGTLVRLAVPALLAYAIAPKGIRTRVREFFRRDR